VSCGGSGGRGTMASAPRAAPSHGDALEPAHGGREAVRQPAHGGSVDRK
jgi:hypothetical protein